MTPDQDGKLKLLLDQVMRHPPEERESFAHQLCNGDTDLLPELLKLLRSSELPDSPETAIAQFPVTNNRPAFFPNQVLLNRFRIVRFLGRGGMGEVYEADDSETGRIALKTIRPEIAAHPHALARFRHEVQCARKVTGTNVCRIHEFFCAPSSPGEPVVAFLTMEFLEGVTLCRRIEAGPPLSIEEAERIAVQICRGLQTIHDADIIHRDLKSLNIMLAQRKRGTEAVLMDFGLARDAPSALTAAAAGSAATVAGAVVGTFQYMAPEQFESGPLTPATDIYALGIVLYEMATGKLPFAGATPLAAAVGRAKPLPRASVLRQGLPRRWDSTIDRCLRYKAEERFQTCDEVAAALTAASISSHAPAHDLRRHWGLASVALALVAIVCVLAFFRSLGHKGNLSGSPEARHFYDLGTAALREGTYLKATNALQMAVDLDKNFALAHARLADAWNELDFSGKAKDEMLEASALESSGNLSRTDRRYVEAIRATVLHDFRAALADYLAIFNDLPLSARGDAYVDLGRAYEKVGDLPRAVASYVVAAKIAPQYPAAFVRLGALEGRQNHTNAAEAAFNSAERLYRASSNYEGIAEIAYERGYVAASNADYSRARALLLEAFPIAENLHKIQLETRVLSELSAVETANLDYGEGVSWAQKAIQVAQDTDLAYWLTEAQIRLSRAFIYQKGTLNDAERYAQIALQSAERNSWPLLAADARLTLCIIRNRQDHPDDATLLALSALSYYSRAAYYTESTRALILLIRAKRERAEFQDALKLCRQGLAMEQKSGSPPMVIQLEEAVGTVYFALENFPEALAHFRTAEGIARQNASRLLDYQIVHVADTVWRLGQYEVAERDLNNLATDSRADDYLASSIDEVRAEMYLSQGRYRDVMHADQRVRALDPDSISPKIDILDALAKLALGSTDDALRLASRALLNAQNSSNELLVARAEAVNARVLLKLRLRERAKALAESAQPVFVKADQYESQWRNLALLSQICFISGEPKSAKDYASKALDIVYGFEHNWGTPAYKSYISRPDVGIAVRSLIATVGH